MENIKRHIKNKTKVYCLENGVGVIIRSFKLYDGVYDYFEVSFSKNDVSKLFSVNDHDEIRLASSSQALSDALTSLTEKFNDEHFEFEYSSFDLIGKKYDILFLIDIIASSMAKKKLTDNYRKMFSRCLNSLLLEISDVYRISLDSAKGIISDHLRSAA